MALHLLLICLSALIIDSISIVFPPRSSSDNSNSFEPEPLAKGQHQVNILRHAASVSNLPTFYGRQKSMLLSRVVVPQHKVWEDVNPFVKQVINATDVLDWYVADVALDNDHNAVTLNGAFSCIDRGESSAWPVQWYVAEGLERLIGEKDKVGGYQLAGGRGKESIHDITLQCLTGRKYRDGMRLVEHHNDHGGTGVRFIVPDKYMARPKGLVDNVHFFDEIAELRLKHSEEHDEVVYHESGVPVAVSLPFDTGFRIWPQEGMTQEPTLQYRVPMLPIAAITSHTGARLRESQVARGQSKTSNILLLLTVWATGLALLLAVWFVARTVTDVLLQRSKDLRSMDVDEAVKGMEGWTIREKAIVVANVAAVTFLAAPIAQAAVEGLLDPRPMIEVTSGASVLYSDRVDRYLEDVDGDETNPFAGTFFVVTVWVTFRRLDEGFVASLALSSAVIVILAGLLVMRVTKKSSEIMKSRKMRWGGVSIWKLIGWCRMWSKSRKGEKEERYKMFVRLRKTAFLGVLGEYAEDAVKEVNLMGNEEFRGRSNSLYTRPVSKHIDRGQRKLARDTLFDRLRMIQGSGCVGLFVKVRLDNKRRFELTTAKTRPWSDVMPRHFEYVRRSLECEFLEHYRTNGQFAPDDALLLLAAGCLPYAKYISEVVWARDDGEADYDSDGVRSLLAIPHAKDLAAVIDSCEDNSCGCPVIRQAGEVESMTGLFAPGKRIDTSEVMTSWPKSMGERNVDFAAGSVRVRYFNLDPKDLDRPQSSSVSLSL